MFIIKHQFIFLLSKQLHLLQQLARKLINLRLCYLSKANGTLRLRMLLQALEAEDMLTLNRGHLLSITRAQRALKLLTKHDEKFGAPVTNLGAPLVIQLTGQLVLLHLVLIKIQTEVVYAFS